MNVQINRFLTGASMILVFVGVFAIVGGFVAACVLYPKIVLPLSGVGAAYGLGYLAEK